MSGREESGEMPVLYTIQSSIFESPAQTLVNTVNTVGVMGKGIAKVFKARYPAMFKEYKQLCDTHVLKIGTLHCWHGPNRWVLNFPTKTTWKKPSRLEYIEAGLDAFVNNYKRMGIQSISFPPLGCGNGQLDWAEVRPMMLHYLWNLDIPIFIHEWFESTSAEQHEPSAKSAPLTFREFVNDLHASVDERRGRFHTLPERAPFYARLSKDNDLEAYLSSKFVIPEEFISNAWAGLQVGLLTSHTLGSDIGISDPIAKRDIHDRRMAEVLVPDELALNGTLNQILCRTQFDRLTLEHLVGTAGPQGWKSILRVVTKPAEMFFCWGSYITELRFAGNVLTLRVKVSTDYTHGSLLKFNIRQRHQNRDVAVWQQNMELTANPLLISGWNVAHKEDWHINIEDTLAFCGPVPATQSTA